jgi:hypothetical protein
MSWFKLIVLSMFAVFAVGALASGSASADTCTGGTRSVFCFDSNNTPIHSEKLLGGSGLSLLVSTAGGAEVKLRCLNGLFNATLKLLGLATGEIDFLDCTVQKPAGQGCTISSLILVKIHLQLSSGLMPATGLATGTGPEEEFTTVIVSGGSCVIAGTYKITGLQTVEFPSGETSLVEHEVVAKKSGSKLKFGLDLASFSSTTKVHLASSASWLIMLGV